MRALYWLATGGEGDLPFALRAFFKALLWSMVALLVYVQVVTPHIDWLGHVVLGCLMGVFVLLALFARLGWD